MTERQQPQISSLDTSNRHHGDDEEFDLENPDITNTTDNDDASDHDSEQYSDNDDATTYNKRSSAYRWVTSAIILLTIIIIFLSRGSFEGVDAKNQDVEKEGGGGRTSLGAGNAEDVVKAEKEKEAEQKAEKSEKSKKSKKSKADKWW